MIMTQHPDYTAYRDTVAAVFDEWRTAHRPYLLAIDAQTKPHELISLRQRWHPLHPSLCLLWVATLSRQGVTPKLSHPCGGVWWMLTSHKI